jgi:GGDEF domain-containing protein
MDDEVFPRFDTPQEATVESLAAELARERTARVQAEDDLQRMTEVNLVLARSRYKSHDELQTREEMIELLEQEKDRDPMTGLLNQKAWRANLEEMIAAGEDNFAVLFIDLSNFKRINDHDRLGHLVGDELIRKTAQVLRQTMRSHGTKDLLMHNQSQPPDDTDGDDHDISRYGGDEFAVLCDLTPRQEESQLTADERLSAIESRLREIFDEMLVEEEQLVRHLGFDMAIGGAVFEPGMSAEELLKQADKTMYKDKFARKAAWQERRPAIQRAANWLGRALLRYTGTLDERQD